MFRDFFLIRIIFIFLFLTFFSEALFAKDVASLKSEPNLNPGDLFVPDVLRKGEWTYGQPPKPIPGWFRWGATDRLTIQFDATAWLGEVPDMNIRWALIPGHKKNLAVSWELMILYFNSTLEHLDDLNEDDSHLFIQRHGMAGYSRLNGSLPLNDTITGVLSVGYSYSHRLRIENRDREKFHGKSFRNHWDPATSLGILIHPSDGWSFHAHVSYGETFLLMENRPRKWHGNYGFRFAPFRHSSKAILANLRVELDALIVYFPDAKETRSVVIPIFPVLYWNWGP